MLNNTLIRNILVSLVIAAIAPLVLPLLAVSPEAAAEGSSAMKTYLLVFVLLMLAASINEFLRLKVAAGSSQQGESQAVAEDADDDREEGVVKWFNVNKGFGFIIRDAGGEVFVHFRSIRGTGHRTLREGQRVKFSAAEGEKGLQAEDVSILNNN